MIGWFTVGAIPFAAVGKKIVGRISDRAFVIIVEIGLIAAGMLFLIGL